MPPLLLAPHFFKIGGRGGGGNSNSFKFQFKTVQAVHPIPGVIMEGDVITITRFENDRVWKTPLYVPQHWVDKLVDMKSFMEDNVKLKLYLSGMQGCGKTCFLWMWANMIANQGKRVLFIRYRPSLTCPIWILEDGETKKMTVPSVGSSTLEEVVRSLVNQHPKKFDVCVCVGVRMDDMELRSLMYSLNATVGKKHDTISKLVYETPYYYHIKSYHRFVDVTATMTMESWQAADYEKAAMSDLVKNHTIHKMLLTDWDALTSRREIVNDVAVGSICSNSNGENTTSVVQPDDADNLVEAVKMKYFYAGGCARFMFDMDIDTLRRVLDEEFAAISKWEFLPNDLLQLLPRRGPDDDSFREAIPVSKYVLLWEYRYFRRDVANDISSTLGHANFMGWHFELSQYDIIRSACTVNKGCKMILALEVRLALQAKTDAKATGADKSSILRFCPQAETRFNGSAIEDEVVSGTVLWNSNLWNQGCFDVAFYVDETIVTLQFADKDSRTLKVQYLNPLRAAILEKGADVHRMVHVVVGKKIDDFLLQGAKIQWQRFGAESDVPVIARLATSASLDRILVSNLSGLVRNGGVNGIYPQLMTDQDNLR